MKFRAVTKVRVMQLSKHKKKDWRLIGKRGYTKANIEWKQINEYLVKKGVHVWVSLSYADDDLVEDFDRYGVNDQEDGVTIQEETTRQETIEEANVDDQQTSIV